jgi:serine protease Do
MVTQILTRAGGFQGISLSTPIEAVMEAVNRLRGRRGAGGAAQRPSLGLLVRDTPQGVEITQVPPGSPAAAARLAAGDYVRAVSGQKVSNVADIERALLGRQSGGSVELTVARALGGGGGKAWPVVLELR